MGLLRTNANHQPRFFDPEPSFFSEGDHPNGWLVQSQVMFQSFLGKVKSYSNREELNQLFCLFGVYMKILETSSQTIFFVKTSTEKYLWTRSLHHELVGGIPTPLKNMSSSGGMIIPNRWKTNHVPNMFQTTNQPLYPHYIPINRYIP